SPLLSNSSPLLSRGPTNSKHSSGRSAHEKPSCFSAPDRLHIVWMLSHRAPVGHPKQEARSWYYGCGVHPQSLLEESGRVAELSVNFTKRESCKKSWNEIRHNGPLGPARFVWLSLSLLVCGFPTLARQTLIGGGAENGLLAAPKAQASTAGQQPDTQSSGRISGRVVDPKGVALPGATVKLPSADQSFDRE